MLEQEQNQSDVSEEVSSEPSSSESNNSEATKEASSPTQKDMPFHEHPRFRELVEQKNKYADSYKSLESKYADMERRLTEMSKVPPSKKEEDALIARLRGVDPEFGERFAKLDATQAELAELKAWRSQMEGDRAREGAVNTIQGLHGQNKLSGEMQELYNEQLEAAYSRDPQNFLRDINNSYKSVHDRMSKMMEGIKRAERESYVKSKTADVKAPTATSKGKAVNPARASDYSTDPSLARSQLIQRVLKQAKASNDV